MNRPFPRFEVLGLTAALALGGRLHPEQLGQTWRAGAHRALDRRERRRQHHHRHAGDRALPCPDGGRGPCDRSRTRSASRSPPTISVGASRIRPRRPPTAGGRRHLGCRDPDAAAATSDAGKPDGGAAASDSGVKRRRGLRRRAGHAGRNLELHVRPDLVGPLRLRLRARHASSWATAAGAPGLATISSTSDSRRPRSR